MGRCRSMSEIPEEWPCAEKPAFANCGAYALKSRVAVQSLKILDNIQEYDPRDPKYTIAATRWQVAELEARHLENQVDSLNTMLESRVKVDPHDKVLEDYQAVLSGFRRSAAAARRAADSLEDCALSPRPSPRVQAVHIERAPLSASRSALASARLWSQAEHSEVTTPTFTSRSDLSSDRTWSQEESPHEEGTATEDWL